MKVVFVASGNKSVGTVSAFVRSQYESLQREGLDMLLFPIRGHGWKSYAKSIVKLHTLIQKERPDVIHAHYSVCGVVAAIASVGTKTKVVVSILGSFPHPSFKLKWVRFFIRYIWDATLTKSQRTANQIGINLPVVPNGVNLDQFAIIDKEKARLLLGFEADKKYVIWCSNPARGEKRYGLAERAVEQLHDPNVVLFPVYDKSHDEVVHYMCAADALLLTSISEGSPNVIKEAMACNCPLVSTDVGDVSWVIDGVRGAYVSKTDSEIEIGEGISKALDFNSRTTGRQKILSLGLSVQDVAKRIKSIYESL